MRIVTREDAAQHHLVPAAALTAEIVRAAAWGTAQRRERNQLRGRLTP